MKKLIINGEKIYYESHTGFLFADYRRVTQIGKSRFTDAQIRQALKTRELLLTIKKSK